MTMDLRTTLETAATWPEGGQPKWFRNNRIT